MNKTELQTLVRLANKPIRDRNRPKAALMKFASPKEPMVIAAVAVKIDLEEVQQMLSVDQQNAVLDGVNEVLKSCHSIRWRARSGFYRHAFVPYDFIHSQVI